MQKCILALDQGTTSSRAIVYDQDSNILFTENQEFKQLFLNNAWIEHDPEEIWSSQLDVAKKVIRSLHGGAESIEAIGITNQRETTILWNRKTGKAIYNAIVWQDRRTAEYCEKLKLEGKHELIFSKTGLILDAYFSASKIAWILDNVKGARDLSERGELAFGTVDSWLCWKLSNGKLHITDASNASRTMLYNIHTLKWDEELLSLFNIPASLLPKVVDSIGVLGFTEKSILGKEIPISGIAGDQQAALFGQLCWDEGMMKCTYGTGSFIMLNTGKEALISKSKLLTTIAWKRGDEVHYAIEGSVFIGGAVIQWLRDEMEFFKEASDSESLAEAAEDNGGIFFVPALAGLGAPYWDPFARGSIFGITRSTSKAHLTRAALESICFQVNTILELLKLDFKGSIDQVRVDGGASANNLLLQFQSDISEIEILSTDKLESTSLGVAYMAGIGVGFYTEKMLLKLHGGKRIFKPEMDKLIRKNLLSKWNEAIKRTMNWEN